MRSRARGEVWYGMVGVVSTVRMTSDCRRDGRDGKHGKYGKEDAGLTPVTLAVTEEKLSLSKRVSVADLRVCYEWVRKRKSGCKGVRVCQWVR